MTLSMSMPEMKLKLNKTLNLIEIESFFNEYWRAFFTE